MTRLAQILTVLCLFFVSCVGTDVGNPPSDDRQITASLEFAAYVPTTNEPGALVVDGDIDIEQVWFNVEEIYVTPVDDCRRPAQRKISGPFVVNLFEREVYPEPPILAKESGELCEIELVFAPAEELPNAAPGDLQGRSFWAQSTGPDGPVSVALERERSLRYSGMEFVIDGEAGDEIGFVGVFDPSDWYSDLPVGQPPSDLDETNAAQAAQFWNTLRKGTRVVRDRNRDRVVDQDEFDMPVGVPMTP